MLSATSLFGTEMSAIPMGGADGGRTGAGGAITELLGASACDRDADG